MNLGKKILELRKEKGITQNELAEKLYVSYQAISQWENGNTNPDISLIPDIAKVFGVTIDELFSVESKIENYSDIRTVNFSPNKLYIVVVDGGKVQRIMDYKQTIATDEDITIKLEGDCKQVESHFSVTVNGEVSGCVAAGDSVTCKGITGSVTAGDSVNCQSVGGSITAGDSISCYDVGGSVSAGGDVKCGNVGGSVSSGGDVIANDITGDIYSGSVKCQRIKARSVSAGTIEVVESIDFN